MLGVLLLTMWIAGQGGLAPVSGAHFLVNITVILDALPAVGAVWLGAAGLGYPLRRALLPEARCAVSAQLGLGLAALLMANWLLAWCGALNIATAWGLCAVGALMLLTQGVIAQRRGALERYTSSIALPWTLPVALPGLGVMLVAAACPPGTVWQMEAFGYDVLTYHLQLPREWLELGAMTGLEHNVYSHMPSLIESAYMMLGAMRGGVHEAVYTCQLFHVSLACFAAITVTSAAARFVNATIAVLGGGVLLALPWTVITGSLAYNEMAMLAFGGAALAVMFDAPRLTMRGSAGMGVLLGAATLGKLTAGLLLAMPIGLIVLAGRRDDMRWRINLRGAMVMALAGLLMLAPYLARNAAWTGNPTFPFATAVFGTAHWNEAQAMRWQRGHGVAWSEAARGEALVKQWLLNTGYGAIGGMKVERSVANIARFDRENGVPVLWLMVGAACALAFWRRETRYAAAVLAALIALQLVVWLSATHLQSRFLVPTLLPTALLVTLGFGELHRRLPPRWTWIGGAVGGVVIAALAVSSGVTLHQQSRATPALLVDSFARPGTERRGLVGDHPINELPRESRTYLVADNQWLLYIDRQIVYHTPFDPSPLGAMMRDADGDASEVTRLLRERGISHVWVNRSELARLHETYGYDAAVTVKSIEATAEAARWRTVWQEPRYARLYALPTAR